jgi:hypothetical protein
VGESQGGIVSKKGSSTTSNTGATQKVAAIDRSAGQWTEYSKPPVPVDKSKLQLVLQSWGLKRFQPAKVEKQLFRFLPQSDLYLDCRGIQEYGGFDRNNFTEFAEAIKVNNPETINAMVTTVVDAIRAIPHRRGGLKDIYKEPFVVTCFCAWGMNRSPTTKYVVAEKLKELGYNVAMRTEEQMFSTPVVDAEL